MNLYNLKYFVDAAKYKSITKSSQINNLSRPAISQAIQRLEDDLGIKLISHKRRSFELTQEGLNLLEKARSILEQVEVMRSEVMTTNGPLFGDFRVGSARTLATFSLPAAMSKLKKQYSQINFKILLANSEGLVEMLSRQEVDLIYFIGDEFLNHHKQLVISRGYFCLIEPKKHSQEDLKYAVTEKRPEIERLKNLFERHFSKPLPVFAEVHSWDAIWTWVNEGVCGGLVPDFMLNKKTRSKKNVKVVLPKVFPYEIKVVFPQAKQNSPIINSFIECMRA